MSSWLNLLASMGAAVDPEKPSPVPLFRAERNWNWNTRPFALFKFASVRVKPTRLLVVGRTNGVVEMVVGNQGIPCANFWSVYERRVLNIPGVYESLDRDCLARHPIGGGGGAGGFLGAQDFRYFLQLHIC